MDEVRAKCKGKGGKDCGNIVNDMETKEETGMIAVDLGTKEKGKERGMETDMESQMRICGLMENSWR